MKLLTKKLEQDLIKNSLSGSNPLVLAHFFNPTGRGNWFAIKYYPKDKLFYGYVSLFGDWNDELGDFSETELAEFRGSFGLGIERDLHWEPTPLQEVKERYTVNA
jgi:hypothetical protein